MSYRYNPLSGKIEFVGSTVDSGEISSEVEAKLANLVDSAPETLDTLSELAAALGDDPNFATTVANQIGTKANSSDLSLVATSGSYSDLSGKPTKVSDFTNDSAFISGYTVTQEDVTGHQSAITITESQISDFGDYLVASDIAGKTNFSDLSAVATSGAYSDLSGTPTKVSDFTNDVQYITDYTVTQEDVTGHQESIIITESQISDLKSYLVDSDLTGYATEAYVNDQGFITGYTVTQEDVTGHQSAITITESQISDFGSYLVASDISGKANTSDLSAVATSGSYSDLSGTPTKVSDFVNDSAFISDYTVTESDVTDHQSAITITESQISDFGNYLVASDIAGKSNFADLSAVATSGAYADLSGTPTKVSDFTNDSAFISSYTVTEEDVTGHQSALSITESQISDLKPYLVSADLTGYATETYVNTQVSGIVDSAPETLNTLNELANALGDDPNFATSISTQIGTKANTSDLSAVATSGAYSDLSGTPTKVSDFTNDAAFITTVSFSDLTSKPTTIAGYGITDAFDGDYNSLINAPTIPEDVDLTGYATETYVGNQGFITDYTVTQEDVTSHQAAITITESQISDFGEYLVASDIAGKSNFADLSAVATSGAYSDLSGTPTKVSDFVNDSAFISGYTVTESDVTGHQTALSLTESQISDLKPYLVSADLTGYATETYVNDQGFITDYTVTESDVTGHQAALSITESQISDLKTYLVASDLSGYATETYVGNRGFITGYTVTESDVTDHQSALSLTESQISDLKPYLVASDLTGYATQTYVDTQVSGIVDSAPETLDTLNELAAALGDDPNFATSISTQIGTKANSADLSTVATSGAYADLSGTPTKVSDFVNDSAFISGYTVTEEDVTGHQSALSLTESQISDLKPYLVSADLTGYATETYVGNQGFITDYTVTQSDVTSHQAALSITESQISDLGSYLVASDIAGKANTADLSAVATSGAYADLSGTPTKVSDFTNDSAFITSVSFADLTSKPTTIAGYGITDAFDGDYNSLTNAPIIPEDVDLTGYATETYVGNQGFITDYTVTQEDVTSHQEALSITESQISDLGSYLVSSDLTGYATETYVGNQGFITGYTVSEEDVTGHQAALSITESQTSALGSYLVSADLSGYATETYVNAQVSGIVDSAPATLDTLNELAAALGDDPNFATTISNQIGTKANSADLSAVATSGAYSDLSGTPTKVSDFTNDSAFISDYTVTESDVTGHQTALSITESQISDLGSYLVAADLTGYATETYVGNQGFITDYTVTQLDVTNHQSALSITESQISDLGSYLVSSDLTGYATETYVGNQGFITDYTVTQEDVTSHQAALSITESQISDLGSYLVAADIAGKANSVDLSTVATSGAYADLSGTPTKVSDFTNDSAFISSYTVTEEDVTGHQAAITITESQISDFGSYLVSSNLDGYATQTYVETKVADLVDSSPETLNTLNELATALGDDPNFSVTISNQIGTKATLTDFSVSNQVASSGGSLSYDSSTGTFSFSPADLSSFITTEQDPIFVSHPSFQITGTLISNWNSAYTWGDHSDAGYLTLSPVPSTSKGSSGDVSGLIAMDSDYIYRCVATYDGTSDIWKRVAFSSDIW